MGSSYWYNSYADISAKTVSCIHSTMQTAVNKIFTPAAIALSKVNTAKKNKKLDLKQLGQKKSILFIVTSPVDRSTKLYSDIVYSLLFKELFKYAQKQKNYSLDVPVHVICDDFALTKIPHFEEYISIFRSVGISTSILLQSEAQLANLYGEQAASVIQDNCDTILYLGGNDIKTCESISERMNVPLHRIMSMPLGIVALMRKGSAPVFAKRYQTLEDEQYLQLKQNSIRYKSFHKSA